jgi:DNA-binding NtrC family response regulator
MTQPILAILSRRGELLAGLPSRLSDRFGLVLCDEPGEAASLFRLQRPATVLLDFADVHRGGEAEGRLLDELSQTLPEAQLRVVTSDLCPEPLARRLRRLGLTALSGRLTAADLATELTRQREKPADVVSPPAAPPAEPIDSGETTLEGISRRFETRTPQVAAMLRDLEVAARHEVTILLIGETGSGKTFLSRLIHEVSPRKDEPFLTVACGALPADLIESELFGHVKGSFTGAHADKDGKFVAAGRGTVLLDEIDVLGPEQQVKLLRVIETGEFEPVGSNVTHRSRARLVVASNLNLQPLVEAGRFRPDLYYRLNMLKFDLPPLRKRKPDLEALARKFVRQLAEKHKIALPGEGALDAQESVPQESAYVGFVGHPRIQPPSAHPKRTNFAPVTCAKRKACTIQRTSTSTFC